MEDGHSLVESVPNFRNLPMWPVCTGSLGTSYQVYKWHKDDITFRTRAPAEIANSPT